MLQISETGKIPRPRRAPSISTLLSKLEILQAERDTLDIDYDAARFTVVCHEMREIAKQVIRMPAREPDDMLRKIAAAGALADRGSDRGALMQWQFNETGYCCDDAAGVLLMTLRDDLNRLKGVI